MIGELCGMGLRGLNGVRRLMVALVSRGVDNGWWRHTTDCGVDGWGDGCWLIRELELRGMSIGSLNDC